MTIIHFFRSTKISLALLIILLPLIALGNIVPQQGRVSPLTFFEFQEKYPLIFKVVTYTSLDHLYTSWWFLLLVAVLFLNLTMVTWILLEKTRRKSKGLHRFFGEAPKYFSLGKFTPNLHDRRLDNLEKVLLNKKFNVINVGGELYGRKNWIGIWGGTILHMGLIFILVGAIISGLTRFSGFAEIGMDQQFYDLHESYKQIDQGLLFPGHQNDISITLKSLDLHNSSKMKKIVSTLLVKTNEKDSVTKTIQTNAPLKYRGMKIYQSNYQGPALLFSSIGTSGTNTGYVNLQTISDRRTSGVFNIPGTKLQAKIEYQEVENQISIVVKKDKSLVYQGPMQVNQILNLDDCSLILLAIKKWTGIIVVYDWAVPIVFFGFWLTITGVALMALFDPQEIWFKRNEKSGEMEILGWGRWQNMFQDELKEIFRGEILNWKH